MATLDGVFAKFLSPDTLTRLRDAAGSPPARPLATIDLVLRKGNVPLVDVEALQFAKSVVGFADSELTTCGWLVDRVGSPSLVELAMLLVPRERPDKASNPELEADPGPEPTAAPASAIPHALDRIRSRLLRAEPLLMVLSLLRVDKFSTVEPRQSEIVDCMILLIFQEQLELGAPDLIARTKRQLLRKTSTSVHGPHTDRELEAALEFLKSVRILCRVVEDVEHVPRLYDQSFRSLRAITLYSKDRFAEIMQDANTNGDDANMEKESALKIHDFAERLDCWNEHLWLALMEDRRADFIPIAPKKNVLRPKSDRPPASRNNLTDVFKLEDAACEECCSVTSLSAYLADLLGLLRDTNVVQIVERLTDTGKVSEQANSRLLDLLARRRPDLQKLALTCANSQTLIPCVALINEVLECYIRYTAKPPLTVLPADTPVPLHAFNTPDNLGADAAQDPHAAAPLYYPGNVDDEVYREVISKQMFPFPHFPFNLARNHVSQVLGTFQLHRRELVETCRSPELILASISAATRSSTDAKLRQQLERGVQEVAARHAAAEQLNLQQADFAAITGETFFPTWFGDLLASLSSKPIAIDTACPWSAATLWGYDDQATMLDVKDGTGLSFIKLQLLHRSGLDFQGLLELTKTQLFGQALVITNVFGKAEFDRSIEDYRLLANASSPPYQPLTEDLCFKMQAFLRLRSKLKWTTRELDAAVYCLRMSELKNLPQPKDSQAFDYLTISPYVIKAIGSLVKLSALCNADAPILLPLWGPMDAFGGQSLLYRKYLTPSMEQVDPIFSASFEDGGFFQIGGSQTDVLSHGPGICAALRWPVDEFRTLMTVAGIESDAELTVESFSTLYRHVLVCRILSVPPKLCKPFFRLFYGGVGANVFDSPTATLATIEKWKTLLDGGWSVEALIGVLGSTTAVSDDIAAAREAKVTLTTAVIDGAADAEKSMLFLFKSGNPGEETLTECAGRLFDNLTAAAVVEFVQGRQTQHRTLTFDKIEDLTLFVENTRNWPKKLTVTPYFVEGGFSAKVQLTGLLSTYERVSVSKTHGLSKSITSEIDSLVFESLEMQVVVQNRLKNGYDQDDFPENILFHDWPDSGTYSTLDANGKAVAVSSTLDPTKINESSENIDLTASVESEGHEVHSDSDSRKEVELIEQELVVRARRQAFMTMAQPTIIQEQLQTVIVNAVKDLVPDLELTVVTIMLSDIVKVKKQDSEVKESALSALQKLNTWSQNPIPPETLNAYFRPTTTDYFVLRYSGSPQDNSGPVKLAIDGKLVAMDKMPNVWVPVRLNGGQHYHLQANLKQSQLSWSTAKSIPLPFKDSMLLPATVVERAGDILKAIMRVAQISRQTQLTAEEIQYFAGATQTAFQFDMNDPNLDVLSLLQSYTDMRKEVNGSLSLVSLLSWTTSATDADYKELTARIAASTGWKEARVAAAIRAKYPNKTYPTLIETFRDPRAILDLDSIMRFDQKLASASGGTFQPLMQTLFNLARPRFTLGATDDFKDAESLLSTLSPSQRATSQEQIMESRRSALVAYLLQQKHIKDLRIWDADGLFELFLIDVQTGPLIRTSRIKQAISAVQLFVQRCMLGLEKGVPKGCIPKTKWDWMGQYVLWEANRKIFLYPENWIDPTLRDDKSELFDQFASSLAQKNLSLATFLQAMQTYIYGLNEIAMLDVVAYLHEGRPKADIFHFFGRTRASPYTFYYRNLSVMRPYGEIFWQPWRKIEMDIPSVETEWNGERLKFVGNYLLPVLTGNRMYLFIPTVSQKTIANEDGVKKLSGIKFSAIAEQQTETSNPKRVWEITMAWTELVKGMWTPKKLAPGSLTIDATVCSSTQFRVDPTFLEDRLSLVVSYSSQGKSLGTRLGVFDFRADQMTVVSDPSNASVACLYPTYFQKASGNGLDLTHFNDRGDGKTKPMIWLPAGVRQTKENIAWTLSKTNDGITGLVVNEQHDNGTCATFFNLPRDPLSETKWTNDTLKSRMQLVLMDHEFSTQLMQAASDIADPLSAIYRTITDGTFEQLDRGFGAGREPMYHELRQPMALYNWEIGLHTISLAVDRFLATQQFDEAIQVLKLIFDPTIDLEVIRYESPSGDSEHLPKKSLSASCWRFTPFQDIANEIADKGETPINAIRLPVEIQQAIAERVSHGGLTHAAARGRPQAYMKWVVMKYASILLASGDVHFSRGTSESLPLATQKYIEAAHVLGPEPIEIPKLVCQKSKPLSFEQLKNEDVNFDLDLPFSPELEAVPRGAATTVDIDVAKQSVLSFLKTGYFCIPLNPRFKQMRTLVNQRLFNIRNSLDIQGRPVTYALREPPIDPGDLVALSRSGVNMSNAAAMVMGERDSPLPTQRFDLLILRALELCSELRGLGDRLLGATEKKDAETFSVLRARHGTNISKMMLDLKQKNLQEAQQALESLKLNRETQVLQLAYHLALVGESESKIPSPTTNWIDIKQNIDAPTQDDLRMTPYEKTEMDKSSDASTLNVIAAGIDGIIAPLCAIPQMTLYTAPLGIGTSVATGGSRITSALAYGSAALKVLAAIRADEGNKAARKAQLTRQLQERRMQANLHGREIKAIDKQIEIQHTRLDALSKEMAVQQAEINDSEQMEAWYRTKYTNEQLYGWLEKNLREIHFQGYSLAITMARRAEAALSFETGRKMSLLKPGGYWDASHDGLLSADYLYLDLKRMQNARNDTKGHDFEVTKTISLRQIDPLALMRLRSLGSTTFSIGEMLFDIDYPGHYMRRIRSVSVSIPAVLGPYTSVNATLTLMEHKYRVDGNISTGKDYLSSQSAGSEAFRTDRIPIASAAISSGTHDAGVFQLDFGNPTYAPFEGAGAISSWRLDLPTELRQFDYESISDVLLHVQYTSFDGGVCLRGAVNGAVREVMRNVESSGESGGFWAMWDLKSDFANEWYAFGNKLAANKGVKERQGELVTMNLGHLKDRLPFATRLQPSLQVRGVTLISKNLTLVNGIKLSSVENGTWRTGNIGDCSLRSCDGLTIADLNGWQITAASTALSKAQQVENVFLLINYVIAK